MRNDVSVQSRNRSLTAPCLELSYRLRLRVRNLSTASKLGRSRMSCAAMPPGHPALDTDAQFRAAFSPQDHKTQDAFAVDFRTVFSYPNVTRKPAQRPKWRLYLGHLC